MSKLDPTKLVGRAAAKASGKRVKTWFDALSPAEQEYVKDVAMLANKNGVPLRPVARELIDELNLLLSAQTVVRTLTNLIEEAK